MAASKNDKQLASELTTMLGSKFPGITVEIGSNERWNRPCATFRWEGFVGLLPEERFHRLMTVIPEALRESRMGGFVWLELATDETVDAFLSLPRSDDIAGQEGAIFIELVETHFFEMLGDSMGPSPDRKCTGDFTLANEILTTRCVGADELRRAKLAFIHHGAFCDCQVLLTAKLAVADLHAGAA